MRCDALRCMLEFVQLLLLRLLTYFYLLLLLLA